MPTLATIIRALPATWPLPLWTLIGAVILSLPLLLAIRYKNRRLGTSSSQVSLFSLPVEIREMIYEELIDAECTPTFPAAAPRPQPRLRFSWLQRKKPSFTKYGILLANRSINQEFTRVLSKKATYVLKVDSSNERTGSLWPLDEDTMSKLRNCEVRIIATSSMLGSRDPRAMPRRWELRERVCDVLSAMKKVDSLRLHVHAVPDRIWNPLWLWSQVSQQFKCIDSPTFTEITFGLESWTLGENCLKRDADGRWKWRCQAGDHVVMDDPEGWQPIREFCAALYWECQVCQQRAAS
ncbi:hypothetical protein IWZ01DRAFT_287061 [Phyllosticta capitalensis]|uniref:Uncharacterized protein n=1 Tax=Phyllosticta capitalensis TaxID=121624 RepID=A0ABR1YNR3_9PEZI